MLQKIIFREYISIPLLVLGLIMTFDLLSKIPIPFLYTTFNSFFLFSLALFFIYYTLSSISRNKISVLYLVTLLGLLVAVIGSIVGIFNYQQPFYIGILAERLKLIAVMGILIVYGLEEGWIRIERFQRVVIGTAFIFFLYLLSLYAFVPAEQFSDTAWVIDSSSKGYRFKFNHTLVVILFFYSMGKGLIENNKKYLILIFLIPFYFIFIYKARSLALSLILASLVFLYKRIRVSRLLVIINLTVILLLVGITAGALLFPEKMLKVAGLFSSALSVFTGGEGTDASSISRITQTNIAWDKFLERPIFGNGFVSTQWNGGFSELYGHFHPSDIGWVGSLFLYGIIGTLILSIPYILGFSYSRRIKNQNDIFYTAFSYTLLQLFIHSAVAGLFVKKLGIVVFVFSVVYFYYHKQKKAVSLNNNTS